MSCWTRSMKIFRVWYVKVSILFCFRHWKVDIIGLTFVFYWPLWSGHGVLKDGRSFSCLYQVVSGYIVSVQVQSFTFYLKGCKYLKKNNVWICLKYFQMGLICIPACFQFFVLYRQSLHCLFCKCHYLCYFCADSCFFPWFWGCMYVFWPVCCFCVSSVTWGDVLF